MLKAITFKILRKVLAISRLDKAISYVIATSRFLEKYRSYLLSTHHIPARRSAIDNLFYHNVLKHWLETEYYYAERYPVAREGKKAILIESGSSAWAATYDKEPFDLALRHGSGLTLGEGTPLYLRLKSCIEDYNGKERCRIVQIGVASGRELAWLARQFPNIKCIGTDAFSGAVDHARERYQLPNLEYHVLPLEKASDLLENYRDDHVFFYTSGLLHFVQPEFVDDFLKYISTFQNLNLFISEPVTLPELDKEAFPKHSTPRVISPLSWTHNYPYLLEKNGLIIQELILTNHPWPGRRKYTSVNCFIWARPSTQEVETQHQD